MLIYLKNKYETISAIAEYDEKTKQIKLLEGSRVAKELSSAPTFRNRTSFEKKRKDTVVDGVVIKSISFSSLSTAATFVMGSNRNGWQCWKDETGTTLANILEK